MEFSVHIFDDGKLGGRVIPVPVPKAQTASLKVEDVLKTVFHNVDLPLEAGAIFALWCTSPLLELQLKPDQKVQSIINKWQALLACYTTASASQAQDDIPLLVLRRNCFFPKPAERKLQMESALKLLYNEAQFNITTYRYVPAEVDYYYDLAAAKACIDLGLYDQHRHTVARMREVVDHYFTPHFIKTRVGETLIGVDHRTQVTKRWLQEYARCSAFMMPTMHLYRRYLQICWNMSTYGAVFFKGAIAYPRTARRPLLDKGDVDVRVAINPDGIHIVHEENNMPLINFAFDQVSWDYAPAEREGEHEFASLYLEFDGEVGERIPCKYLIEVFSRQAKLMDAMVGQCVEMGEEDEERVAEERRRQGLTGRVEEIPSIQTSNRRDFHEVQHLAKYVAVQTCVNGRCFPGLPKAPELVRMRGEAGGAPAAAQA